MLRVFANDRPMDRVRGDAAILEYLALRGVPCEHLVTTTDGSGCVDLDGRGVIVTQFVEGVRPSRSPSSMRRLGEALGQINAAPAVGADRLFLGRRAGAIPREDLDYGMAQLSRVEDRVPADARELLETFQAQLEATNDCECLPSGLIHSDCHLDNTIESPDREIILIDWVGAGQGPKLAPIGVLLYSAIVQSPGDVPSNFLRPSVPEQQPAIDAFVSGYSRYHTLSTDELSLLPDAIRVRPLVVAVREFAASIETGIAVDRAGWWTGYH
ncbi:MAG: phosphotransferase enzyme family protein, partial [Thermomicrobiales bacterium]